MEHLQIRCPDGACAVQAAYNRFLVGKANEDDAKLLVRAGLVEAIYTQQPRLVGYRFRIPQATATTLPK